MPPEFLSLDEIVEIHRDQIDRYGGEPGIRDVGLLQSAAAMPRAAFGGKFLHSDIYEMAAAYLFHIVRNHPFVDGNKRTGAVAAVVFLAINGVELQAGDEAFEGLVVSAAAGKIGKKAIAAFLREHSNPVKD
jgi:death-on-curing protein